MDELAGAEPVDVHRRELRPEVGQHVEVPLQREPGVMTALDEDLIPVHRQEFLNLSVQLLHRDHVGAGILLRAVEIAEFAVNVADVRVVDVAVNDVGDDLVAAPAVRRGLGQLPASMRQRREFLQGQGVELQRLGSLNAHAVPDPLQQGLITGSRGFVESQSVRCRFHQ